MPDIEALIRERAYIIWEQSGRPAGRDKDHWFQAAKEADVTANKPQNGAAGPREAVKTTEKKTAKKR
ncbi:MAG TPA: DUF2934 domain-containing protein [Bauldia sp.]